MGQDIKKEWFNTDVFVYSSGLVHCSACAPDDMPRIKVEELVNLHNPSGVTPWRISEDKEFAGGGEMPGKCDKYPTESRLHYLLSC